MDSKSSSRLDLKLLVVALICLCGSGLGGYYLWVDLNAKAGAGIGKPMAKVERRELKVRRKPGNSYMWANVEDNEDLYKKDAVQTGSGSAAIIRLNDGSQLEIGENSLVVIDDIQQLALNFQRGSLIIRKADGGDQRITVDKDGKAKVEELPIRLKAPEPLSQYFVGERAMKAVRFSWEPRGQTPPQGFVIQVSPDRSFKSSQTRAVALNDPSARESELQLPAGRYFWRVMGKGAAPSETRQFQVATAFALRPAAPNPRQKIFSWGGDSTLQFRWVLPTAKGENVEESLGDGVHEIEIATDAEFKNVVRKQEIAADTQVAALKGIGEGGYFWRIRSHYGEMQVAGDTERFAIEKGKQVGIELGKPDKDSTFEARPQVVFTWDSDSDNVDFVWELQDSKGNSVQTNKGRARNYAWPKAAAGAYKWKVTAMQNDQKVGESAWRAFSIFQGKPVALKAPAKNQEIYYWDDPAKFSFEWTEDPLVAKEDFQYQLDVAKDADFKSVAHTKRTEKESVSSRDLLNFGPGTYYWRVRLVDKSGQTMKSSEVAKFVYGTHPTLQPPAESKPLAGAEFNVLEDEKDPVLSWAPVEGAEAYELVVYSPQAPSAGRATASAGGNKIAFRATLDKTSTPVKGLSEGKYFWTVRSVDRMKRLGEPMPPKWFSISYGTPLGAPESTTPEVQ